MSGIRGFIVGLGGLTLLEVALQQGPAGRVGGVFDVASSVLRHWLDPYIPLIPDLRQGTNSPFGSGPPAHMS